MLSATSHTVPVCVFVDLKRALLLRQFVVSSQSTEAPKDYTLVCAEWMYVGFAILRYVLVSFVCDLFDSDLR